MFIEKIKTPGLSRLSYLIGSGGAAAVVDPRRDCEIYVEKARTEGMRITHVLETHRNEDWITPAFSDGDRRRLDASAGAAVDPGKAHVISPRRSSMGMMIRATGEKGQRENPAMFVGGSRRRQECPLQARNGPYSLSLRNRR
jgi:hypothetical protein